MRCSSGEKREVPATLWIFTRCCVPISTGEMTPTRRNRKQTATSSSDSPMSQFQRPRVGMYFALSERSRSLEKGLILHLPTIASASDSAFSDLRILRLPSPPASWYCPTCAAEPCGECRGSRKWQDSSRPKPNVARYACSVGEGEQRRVWRCPHTHFSQASLLGHCQTDETKS